MNLSIEELKTIRLGLNKVAFSDRNNILDTMKVVDAMLAEHNLKGEYESLPRRKYARSTESKFVFNPIKK
jgi:hypothetical protein